MLDKELLSYIKEKRFSLALIVFLSFLGLVSSVCATFTTCKGVSFFIDSDFEKGIFFLSFAFLFALLFAFFTFIKGRQANGLADYVSGKIRRDLFDKYVRLNGKSKLKIEEIAQLSSEGIEQLRLYYSSYLPSFFYSMIAPLSLFVLFCFFSWKVALLYLACVPLIPISIIVVSKWAKKIFAVYWNKYLSLGGNYLDSIKGMKELLIFHYDSDKEQEMMKNSEEFRRITMKVLVMQLSSTTIMDFVAYGGAAVGIVLTLLEFQNGVLSLPIALFLMMIGSEFFLPLRSLGSAFHIAMNGATAGRKVLSLFKEEVKENGKEKISSISQIELLDVSFSYPDSETEVLSHLNMTLKKGMVSLIGRSGSGKSTLAKILTKEIPSYRGKILVDGTELKDIDISEYRKHVCSVSMDTYLLSLPIKESFRFYNQNLTEEEMLSYLDLVSLKERILSSGGLDYVPKEGASDLSGGEKQRLILAYYLSVERDFYVFDETTSNIDKESEDILIQAMRSLSKDHIVLLVSHRLKNSLLSDVVYLLQDNRITDDGRPEELQKKNLFYRNGIENENKWEEIL